MEFAVYAVGTGVFDIFAVQVGVGGETVGVRGGGGGGVMLQFCATACAVHAVNNDTFATFAMQVTHLASVCLLAAPDI